MSRAAAAVLLGAALLPRPALAQSWSADLDLSGAFNGSDGGFAVLAVGASPDGGAIVAGIGMSHGGPGESCAAGLGPDGSVEWVKSYGRWAWTGSRLAMHDD